MSRLTPFEQGYADFLAGIGLEDNPYNLDSQPYPWGRWRDGWKAARKSKQEKMT